VPDRRYGWRLTPLDLTDSVGGTISSRRGSLTLTDGSYAMSLPWSLGGASEYGPKKMVFLCDSEMK